MLLKSRDAAVAQSVERRIGSAEVTGPIPVSSFGNPQNIRLCGFLFCSGINLGIRHMFECLVPVLFCHKLWNAV